MDEKKQLTSVIGDDPPAADIGADRARRIRMKLRRLPSAAAKLWKEYRRDARIHAREGAVGFALGLCAYLLGSCPLLFGTSPLGLALLCASPKKIIWIFSGLCLSALNMTGGSYLYIFAYATAVSVRILARLLIDTPSGDEKGIRGKAKAIFSESVYLRMATGGACAFIIGIYSIIAGNFQYYHLFGAIFSILCTPAATFVYAGCFDEKNTARLFRELSIGVLLVSLSFALRNMHLIGISAGVFFTYFVTLYVSRHSGILKGAIIGLAAGLAYSPVYAPMFALSGITVGVLWDVSAFGALVAGGTAGMLWGFYIEGVSAMSRLMPAIMLSSVCYMGARKLSLFPAAKDLLFSGKYCSDMNDAAMDRESRDEAYKKIGDLSDAFGSLSELFYNLSDRLCRPGLTELRRMCDGVYDKYCPRCPSKNICWELEYASSKEMLTALSERLRSEGIADGSELPEYMRARCVALPGIIGEINHECSKLCGTYRLTDKTEVFAMDYGAVAGLLSEVCGENKKNYTPDRELSEKLGSVLAEYGFGGGGVSVYGERQKHIVARGFDVSKGNIGAADLKKSVEKACGFPLSDPIIEIKDNILTMKMTSAKRFSATSSTLTAGAGGEKCGDTASAFEGAGDRYYALISDGMGTGGEAHLTSSVCSAFLQRMLSVGNRAEEVIKMLSAFIRAGRSECSATVDLLELDLLTGRGRIIKCGAALSLVKRGESIFKLSATTLPIGILDAIDAQRLSFDVESGDVIVMVSDGVTDGEDCMWLQELLLKEWKGDGDAMAKLILSRARKKGSRDDLSVVITKVS